MSNELYRLTATEAARRIAMGTLKPAAFMEACLARIAEREPTIHAFVHLDPEAARAAVPQAGPLHGIPKAHSAHVAWARAAGDGFYSMAVVLLRKINWCGSGND